MEFSREWNIPVHNFFRRHVYIASRSAKMSRPAATALTFLISALAHELIMGCITRKFRGYGFVLMMFQMPFVMVQRMPWVRDRQLLNNIIFWICMIFGLSLVSSTSSHNQDATDSSRSYVHSTFSSSDDTHMYSTSRSYLFGRSAINANASNQS